MRRWFLAEVGGTSTVDMLASVAHRNVLGLMRTLRRIEELRRRPTDSAADFRVLAEWFAQASSDDGRLSRPK